MLPEVIYIIVTEQKYVYAYPPFPQILKLQQFCVIDAKSNQTVEFHVKIIWKRYMGFLTFCFPKEEQWDVLKRYITPVPYR